MCTPTVHERRHLTSRGTQSEISRLSFFIRTNTPFGHVSPLTFRLRTEGVRVVVVRVVSVSEYLEGRETRKGVLLTLPPLPCDVRDRTCDVRDRRGSTNTPVITSWLTERVYHPIIPPHIPWNSSYALSSCFYLSTPYY